MESVTRIQMLDEAVCVLLDVNALDKGMKLFSSPSSMG